VGPLFRAKLFKCGGVDDRYGIWRELQTAGPDFPHIRRQWFFYSEFPIRPCGPLSFPVLSDIVIVFFTEGGNAMSDSDGGGSSLPVHRQKLMFAAFPVKNRTRSLRP
jgi:hypothetical protein